MGLLNFFKKKVKAVAESNSSSEGTFGWTGKDFEFLITGVIDIPADDYDQIMTPNSLEWIKVVKDEWPYYRIGNDEFSYSWEMPGIQMTFNEQIPFVKAKKIADEVIDNIKGLGQSAELVTIDKTKLYRFE